MSLPERHALLPAQVHASTALCVLGAWRAFDITGPMIRDHAIRPLKADAFALIEHDKQNKSWQTAFRCKALLGAGAHCRVGERRELVDTDLLARFDEPGMDMCVNQHAALARNKAVQPVLPLLQIYSCYSDVKRAGDRRGTPYRIIGRLRTDMLLFEKLPLPFLKQFAADEATLVSGDQWGAFPDNVTTMCDNMLIGGERVMEADAHTWQHLLAGDRTFCGIAERRQRQTLAKFPKVTRADLAYCKIADSGACRYLGELRLSSNRLQLAHVLTAHEHACDRLRMRGVCNPVEHNFPQTLHDRHADPNFCELQAACEAATLAIVRPWRHERWSRLGFKRRVLKRLIPVAQP